VVSDGIIIDDFAVIPNSSMYDVEVIDVHFGNKCSMSTSEQIGISVRNKSIYPVCYLPVKVVITHPFLPTQILTGTIPGPILKGQRVNYYFSSTADLLVVEHIL
jgi:hypothetical protein